MVRIIPKRDKTLGGVLAIFTGTIGLHKFYMGQWKQGLVYLLFFWSGVPTVLGIIDGARLLTQAAEETPDVDEYEPPRKKKKSKKEDSSEEAAEDKEETSEEVKDDTSEETAEDIEDS